jgi:signal transduction histidine kinase
MKIKTFQNLGPLAGGLCAGSQRPRGALEAGDQPWKGADANSPPPSKRKGDLAMTGCRVSFHRRIFLPGIDLQVDIADDVADITTDQRRLEQVLINLLNNAVKFTEQGRVEVSCRGDGDFYRFVQKPFSRQELAVKVAEALGQMEGG